MNIRGGYYLLLAKLFSSYILKKNLGGVHHHLLVACQPKSGSTYLSTILSALPKFQAVSLVPGYGHREQEIDDGLLTLFHDANYVAHHHVRFSEPTSLMIRRHNIRPVVMVRDIFDTVLSVRDHIRNESIEWPMGYVTPEMVGFSDEDMERFIVHMILPWYFNFYLSWRDCGDKCLVRYEDMVSNPFETVNKINLQFELGASDSDITSAIEVASGSFTRKNKGVSGRGKGLEEETRAHIYKMASFYKGVDFSPLGISPDSSE